MNKYGMVRITAVCPRTVIGNPKANAEEHIKIIRQLPDSDIIFFPELSITGYTCGELFHQATLLREAREAISEISQVVGKQLVVVGVPLSVGNALYNCGVALNYGCAIGAAAKEDIPNYGEFYEGRWFAPGWMSRESHVNLNNSRDARRRVPFGTDLIFEFQPNGLDPVTVFLEICESLWMPIPPSSFGALAGAVIVLNQSASNDTVNKAYYRENLVIGQSGRCSAAYGYASAGPTESTADLVMGGHLMIAEGGRMLEQKRAIGGETPIRDSFWITADVDVERLWRDRRATTSFNYSSRNLTKEFQKVLFTLELERNPGKPKRFIDATPFVPKDADTRHERCREIFGIQTCGLAKRMETIPTNTVFSLGMSGGLDSTLAATVAVKTVDMLGVSRKQLHLLTMPGFGTDEASLKDSLRLMDLWGVTAKKIDIRPGCYQEMRDLGYRPFGIDISTLPLADFCEMLKELPSDAEDLGFENMQARRRTEILMAEGFVLGTGDMSESFFGWCTYNGDHQSMYNVNAGVPKTLVKWLVRYVAEEECSGNDDLSSMLLAVSNRLISAQLLPCTKDGKVRQSTEGKIGPYELGDFVMANFVRYGYSPEKILWLGEWAEGWSCHYSLEERRKWMDIELRRVFSQQYKREDVPNGPKVGSVALSPRGDWRMPPDASVAPWLRSLSKED